MRRSLLLTLAGLATLIAAVGGVAPVPAEGQTPETVGIRILDAPSSRADDPRAKVYIVDHVEPGTTLSRRVEVRNDTNETQSIQLYPAAATVADGTFQFGEGRAVNDLITWTTVDPPNISLDAGAIGEATVTIAIPPNATAGEQYGVVWAELNAPPPPGGGIGATNRVGVRIYLSVGPGGEPPSDFEITSIQAERAADGSPLVAATVHNTGGRALDMSGELRLTNGPGALSAGPFNATLGSTLGLDQSEPVLVTLDKALPNGPWDVKITLRSGTTSRDAAATITFPDQPATSSPPVEPDSGGGSGNLIAAGAGIGGLVIVAGIVLWIVTRRRKREQPAA